MAVQVPFLPTLGIFMNLKKDIEQWSNLTFNSEFDENFGCLHVFLGNKDSKNINSLREHILAIYKKFELNPFAWSDYLAKNRSDSPLDNFNLMEKIFPLDEMLLKLNLSEKLQPDEVIIFPEATDGWYEISSRQYEWTLPGLNPLAKEISKIMPVLSTTHVLDHYDEMTIYKNGKAESMFLNGIDKEDLEPEVAVDEFDWSWFADKGCVVSANELEAETDDFTQLMSLAGPDSRGYRNFIIDNTIMETSPEFLFSFREKSFSLKLGK